MSRASSRAIAAIPGIVALLVSGTCGAAPTAPVGETVSSGSTASAVAATTGVVRDAISAAGLGAITFGGVGIVTGSTDSAGLFSLGAFAAGADPIQVTFTGSGVVGRLTYLRVPGPDVSISLIPSSFDLSAFNEMFRQNLSLLSRWTTAPPLVIQTRVLTFTSTTASDALAGAGVMTDPEVGQLAADLTWALPQLTGSAFGSFASIVQQSATEGSSVHILNSGQITVARYRGLTAATGYWGYTRWQYASDGTVSAGTIMLDFDFDTRNDPHQRSLRAHELGHALGYNHVTVRTSVMNSNAVTEPNGFDRQGALIAFQRTPGNRSPDVDPSTYSTNRFLTLVWSAPIH